MKTAVTLYGIELDEAHFNWLLSSNKYSKTIGDEAEAHTDEESEDAEETTETITHERKKPTRQPLPKDLPREQVIHDVAESEKQCDCGCAKQRIGEEISE